MAADWDILLTDVPAFERLRLLEEKFGVEFILFGGAATRLAIALHDGRSELPNLVELAPFSSDIDIAHTGPDRLTPLIQQLIDAIVPAAGWCRWSVVGRRGWNEYLARRRSSAEIPLRNIIFRTRRPVRPTQRALVDLAENRVSLFASATFRESTWHKQRRDLEIFSALVALGASLDLAEFERRRSPSPRHRRFPKSLRFVRGCRQFRSVSFASSSSLPNELTGSSWPSGRGRARTLANPISGWRLPVTARQPGTYPICVGDR